MHEGTVGSHSFFTPRKLHESEILAVHKGAYWKKLQDVDFTRQEERRSGFPISAALVEREVTINGGTIQCAEFALEHGIAMNIAGGTHHAYPDRAEGFCLLNDIGIASMYLLDRKLSKQILVIDLDVHQGNGTAKMFEEVPEVFTFSMHGDRNYPLQKEQSDLDVPMADGTEDREYLGTLQHHLSHLIRDVKPDFIFYQSGVDVLKTDKLGRLGLTLEGCKKRDRMVISAAKKSNIPLVASMGGGYSKDIRTIIEAHANTFRVAVDLYF